MQIIKQYHYSPGDCLFDSITYLEFKRRGIPMNDTSAMTAYSNFLKHTAVLVIMKKIDRGGRARARMIESIDAVKDVHLEFTSDTSFQEYLRLMDLPTRDGGIWSDAFVSIFVA